MRQGVISISAAVLGVMATLLLGQMPASSTGHLDRPYDWTVEVQTQKLVRQFDYEGSTLQQVVKTQIRYYPTTAEDNKTAYENMWFSNGKALGLERLHNFDITPGDGISIRILAKTGRFSPEERKAAANVMLRIILDAYVNRNAVVTVRLPNNAFSQIIEELHRNPHITRSPEGGEAPVDAALSIFVQSESSGRREQLLYI